MNKMRNVHSAPGMPYYSRKSLRHLTDCPHCKYGTLDLVTNRETNEEEYRCADCQWIFPKATIEKKGTNEHNPTHKSVQG